MDRRAFLKAAAGALGLAPVASGLAPVTRPDALIASVKARLAALAVEMERGDRLYATLARRIESANWGTK